MAKPLWSLIKSSALRKSNAPRGDSLIGVEVAKSGDENQVQPGLRVTVCDNAAGEDAAGDDAAGDGVGGGDGVVDGGGEGVCDGGGEGNGDEGVGRGDGESTRYG